MLEFFNKQRSFADFFTKKQPLSRETANLKFQIFSSNAPHFSRIFPVLPYPAPETHAADIFLHPIHPLLREADWVWLIRKQGRCDSFHLASGRPLSVYAAFSCHKHLVVQFVQMSFSPIFSTFNMPKNPANFVFFNYFF